MEIEDSFDENVRQIVEEIRSFVPVEFKTLQNKDQYGAIIKKDNADQPQKAIVYYYKPISQAKLFHELLHIKIGVLLGDNTVMLDVPDQYKNARQLLCKEFCADFLNHSEHFLFYSEYEKKGYDSNCFYESIKPELFKEKLDELEKSGLKSSNGYYNIDSIYSYFALTTLYLLFPIDNRFKTEINTLKHLDRDLFQIMKEYKQGLSTIKIDSENKSKLQELYKSFRDKIFNWFSKHKFNQ